MDGCVLHGHALDGAAVIDGARHGGNPVAGGTRGGTVGDAVNGHTIQSEIPGCAVQGAKEAGGSVFDGCLHGQMGNGLAAAVEGALELI